MVDQVVGYHLADQLGQRGTGRGVLAGKAVGQACDIPC